MAIDPRTPVLVGSGQFIQRVATVAEALDPISMIGEAIRSAAADAGLGGVPDVDSLRIVSQFSWRYENLPEAIANDLRIAAADLAYSTAGGNTPQSLVNTAAGEIQSGALDIAILAGGEAMHTRLRARKEGIELTWPKPAATSAPRPIGEDLVMNHPSEVARSIVMPVQVYPMFETAIRSGLGRSPEEHVASISEMWAGFSTVAAGNPYAWSQTAKTADEIRTPGPDNRMIGLPYPKLMNSNNNVDQSAAVIICSVSKAQALGIAEDRWVFIHSGADCHEHAFISNRFSFARTPAIELGGRMALELAGLTIDDVGIVDLYSCFPAAVQLGARSLGVSLDRQLTRTGGLAFAGGPWNNYVMHAIATTMNDVRDASGGTPALVWGNGGYATKHAFGVYSASPPANGFRHGYPQAEIDAMPSRQLAEPADAVGSATIEAYTVIHSRDGRPETAIASCLLADGRRAWGTSTDADLTAAMCEGEWVDRTVQLDDAGTVCAA